MQTRRKQNHDQLSWSWPLKAKKLSTQDVKKPEEPDCQQIYNCVYATGSDTTATREKTQINIGIENKEGENLKNYKSARTSGSLIVASRVVLGIHVLEITKPET